MNRPFILIASYPKSGNTWTRVVLERLRWGAGLSINAMGKGVGGASRRLVFDRYSPVDASDLLTDEIVALHPGVYREFSASAPNDFIIKVHEIAYGKNGARVYPADCVAAVIYLVRHPFDVAVSFAHHFGQPIEKAVEFMGDTSALPLASSWLPGVIPMPYGTWSANVSSWLDANDFNVTWARYEDLHAAPMQQFMRLANAVGLHPTEQELSLVIEASRFESLKKEEEDYGFNERPRTSPQFFRSGRTGSWEGVLTEALREKIVRDHAPVMERLGYTAEGGALPLG